MASNGEIRPITASALEIEEARLLLSQYYGKDVVEEKIEKCLTGWLNAPKVFAERVTIVAGRSRKDKRTGLVVGKKDLYATVAPPSGLTEEESLYWKNRYKLYNTEFDFNKSSDKMVLEQVLTDEILINRLRVRLLKDENTTSSVDSDLLDEIMNRYRENLNKLGILRIQRDLAKGDIEGSIAELTGIVDDKIAKMVKLDTVDFRALVRKAIAGFDGITEQEIIDAVIEAHCARINEMRGDLNPVPQEMMEKVKAGKMDIGGDIDG